MSGRFRRFLLGVPRDEEVRRAREQIARDRDALLGDLAADEQAFAAEMRRRERTPHVVVGESLDKVPYRIPLAHLATGRDGEAAHAFYSGSTGSGKTMQAAALVDSILERLVAGAPVAVVVLALQGNFADLVLRALGARLARAPAERRRAVLSQLLTARFFRGATLPEWNILAATPHAPPLVQAGTIAEVLENALGASLGGRQETALTMLLALAIELALPISVLRLCLHEPDVLQDLARRSKEPLVTSYVLNRFARESAATIDGLGSRIDRLLSLDAGIRGALAGPGTIDFARRFEPGAVSALDLSGTPLGAEGARLAISALLVQSLAFAALSAAREVRGHTLLFVDEAQLAFTPATARTLATLLTTVRQFGVGLHFINQSLVQIPRDFVHLLATNIKWRFLGRSGRDDATLSSEFLPRTGRLPKPPSPFGPPSDRLEFQSRAEETEARIAAVGTMPSRHFLVTERAAPFGPREVVARDFNPPSWDALPGDLREALERGASGVPRTELIARARRAEADALARFAASREGDDVGEAPARPARRGRAKGSLPKTPDAITRAARWGRRDGDDS
ncbi:MAG: hypothetical protein HY909_15915 [Deltaproteobacteria bacterium]|nr:hypothetical protein [Deltaproteobacteria bacterium]